MVFLFQTFKSVPDSTSKVEMKVKMVDSKYQTRLSRLSEVKDVRLEQDIRSNLQHTVKNARYMYHFKTLNQLPELKTA